MAKAAKFEVEITKVLEGHAFDFDVGALGAGSAIRRATATVTKKDGGASPALPVEIYAQGTPYHKAQLGQASKAADTMVPTAGRKGFVGVVRLPPEFSKDTRLIEHVKLDVEFQANFAEGATAESRRDERIWGPTSATIY